MKVYSVKFTYGVESVQYVQTSTYYAQQVCKIIHLCTKN